MGISMPKAFCLVLALVLLNAAPAAAFGAGNIASISAIEGLNWRHGDIEDTLKTIAFLKGHKWTSLMVKRVYFGNWLRDYSQAMDVGTLKGVQSGTIRILVWILSFLSFGYATKEFEVTEERLGVYRPEEHIDNPKDYADNVDARQFDPRLRPPVEPLELEVDLETGMKNYIANENLGIATSAGYVKFSFTRSIHFGRVYTSGNDGTKGKEEDLYEALRCLGQGLHCLEDFGAHTNYTELALREMGHRDVFAHTGVSTEINLHGHRVFPLVTGTFGVVDFLHSVLGEATDHFTQSEVEEMDIALKDAEAQSKASGITGLTSGAKLSSVTTLLSQVPGAGGLVQEARDLQEKSDVQEQVVTEQLETQPGEASADILGRNIDPAQVAQQIYPILEFRDKVVKMLERTIEKIPGLEALVTKITETITLFVLSLLAPFIRPVIDGVSAQLKKGSGGVISASGQHQYEPWTDPRCTDPTHSLLSKDHFANILNEPAGKVASAILQYVAPRVIYAWQHPGVPVDQVLNDVVQVFHHPALRKRQCEIHQTMYQTVERWVHSRPDGGRDLNTLLSSDSVRHGRNLRKEASQMKHSHGGLPNLASSFGGGSSFGSGTLSKITSSLFEGLGRPRGGGLEVGRDGADDGPSTYSSGSSRELPSYDSPHQSSPPESGHPTQQPSQYGDREAQAFDPTDFPSAHSYGYGGPPPSRHHGYAAPSPNDQYYGDGQFS